MKIVLLLLILLIASCSSGGNVPTHMIKIPSFDNAWQIQPKKDSIMIEWRDETNNSNGYAMNGNWVTGRVKGVAISPGYIWVWRGQYERLAATALVHELIHVALWLKNGEADSDHEGTKYKGWTKRHTEFMHSLNYLLATMDLQWEWGSILCLRYSQIIQRQKTNLILLI